MRIENALLTGALFTYGMTKPRILIVAGLLALLVVSAAAARHVVVIKGTNHADVLTGRNDKIRGRHGDDTVDGGAGNDRLFVGRGTDIENGGEGDDVLHALAFDGQVDTLDCGPGHDVVWLNANEQDVQVNCEVIRTVSTTTPDD